MHEHPAASPRYPRNPDGLHDAVGCHTAQDVEVLRTLMTVKEAQKSIVRSFNDLLVLVSVREVKCSKQRLTFKADHKHEKSRTYEVSVKFADLGTLTVRTDFGDTRAKVESDGKPVLAGGPDR